MASIREDIAKYIKEKYKASPEYLWKRYPRYAVFRHDDNRKWFAAIMNITADKIGAMGCDEIDIIDVKIDDINRITYWNYHTCWYCELRDSSRDSCGFGSIY